MTFSGIAVEQRSKETEALRSFLVYSLIGSVALHIGILAIGIGNLLQRTSEVENEPLEVTIIDTPKVEPEPTPLEIKPEPKPEPETRPQPQAIAPLKLNPEPVQKVSNNLKTPQVQQPPNKTSVPTVKTQSTTQTQPVLTSEPTNTQQTTIQAVEQSSNKLRGLLSGIRDARANSDAVGESNNSTNTGSNVPVRRSRGIEAVATAPSPAKIETPPTSNNTNNSSRSGNGRAACRDCGTKYPEAARRRGVEGKVGVAVDTDEKGNVTNVRIVNSSGNRDLDEETLRQARNWKLKPSASGRSGVSIDTEYAIAGSRRYRELQERKRQARQRATAANTNTTEAASSNRQSSRASSNTGTPTRSNTENRVRRRRLSPTSSPDTPTSQQSTASSTNTRRTSDNQRSVRNSLRRVRRERTATQLSPPSQPNATRRRRRNQTQEASSSSSSRLRNALRRSRQPSQPQSSSPDASTSQ